MKIVIIGSGLAGHLVLRGLRAKGFSGEMILISEHSADFYTKPSLSNLCKMNKQPHELIQMSAQDVASTFNTAVISHQKVNRIDRQSKILHTTGGEYSYDALVLATGAKPRDLDILPQHENVFRVNDLWAYESFAKSLKKQTSLCIIGGGLIGCEFANDLKALVNEVTIIEPTPYLMGQMLPKEMSNALKSTFEDSGINVILGQSIKHIDGSLNIALSEQIIGADVIMAAVGLVPEVSLAKQAGLEVDQGIIIDANGQTSDSSIYALGDCAQFEGAVRSYVAPLKICADVISSRLAGAEQEIIYPPMPVIVKTPLYPMCFCFHASPTQWNVEQTADGIKALAYDQNHLVGYALSGTFMKQRQQLSKQMNI